MSKKIRVAINGFGRIGRIATRLMWDAKDELELVAINDLTPLEQNAHLLKYDSVHGQFNQDISVDKDCLKIGDHSVKVYAQREPLELPWKDLGIDMVIESTGIFTSKDGANRHLEAGAKKVLISAPTSDPDSVKTIVYGINHQSYNPDTDHIFSNASCTTNCLAPVAKVLQDSFGIERGLMTTVHSYTNDQKILDLGHKDYRRMRAGALNMIPTTTGAAKAVAYVIPELKGKLTGLAVRVPTPNVSLVDFVADVQKDVSVEAINQALTEAANGPLKGVLAVTNKPLVSSDFNGCRDSSTVDALSTQVIDNRMVKVFSWYDNETGFSQRMIDLAKYVGKSL